MTEDIFQLYAQEMIDQGLVVVAEEDLKKSNYNNQARQDNAEEIALLYGHKLLQDGKDILDQAHPTSTIMFEAYDSTNGLIENLKERQRIMVDLALRSPNGKLVNHRYVVAEASKKLTQASEQLTQELLKIAIIADQQNLTETMLLADHCAAESTEMIKEAIGPLLILGLLAGAITAMGFFNNFSKIDQGVINNCQHAIEGLNDFKTSTPQLNKPIEELITGITFVKELTEKVAEESVDALPKNVKKDQVITQAQDFAANPRGKKLIEDLNQLQRVCQILGEEITRKYMPLFETAEEKKEDHYDLTALLLKGYRMIFPEEKKKVLMKLETLATSMKETSDNILKRKNAVENYLNQNKDQIAEYLEANKTLTDNKKENSEDHATNIGNTLWS